MLDTEKNALITRNNMFEDENVNLMSELNAISKLN